MRLAQSNPSAPFPNATVRSSAIESLETVLLGVSTLRNVQGALNAGRLEHAKTLLQDALDRVLEAAQRVNRLLTELDGRQSQRDDRQAQRPRLEIQTLGALEVRLDSTPVTFPFARCSELLVWLVLHGPASRDQICDALWDGYVNRSNLEYFRVVVRRTRTALVEAGSLDFNPLVFEHKVYRLADQLEVGVDVLELAATLKDPSPKRLRAALELYKGDFLPHAFSEWASLQRTLIVDLALETAMQLAKTLEEHDPRQAIEIYQRAIEIEPLSETAETRLIDLYERLGERSAAETMRRASQKMLEHKG